jgi:hypothetical protein
VTPDAAWKRDERRVAAFLGSVRTPLSGGSSRHTRSDTLHSTLFVEVKTRSAVPSTWPAIVGLLEDIERPAAVEQKRAVLVTHKKHVRNVGDWPAFLRVVDGELAGVVVGVPLGTVRDRLLPKMEG